MQWQGDPATPDGHNLGLDRADTDRVGETSHWYPSPPHAELTLRTAHVIIVLHIDFNFK